MTKTKSRFLSILFTVCMLLSVLPTTALAEGSADLTESGTGNRPYTEWYNQSSMGLERKQVIYVYAKAGETINFGDSVLGSSFTTSETRPEGLENKGNIEVAIPAAENAFATYPDKLTAGSFYDTLNPKSNEITDASKVYLFETSSTTGYISTRAQEQAGPNVGDIKDGYNPLSFVAPVTGVYSFRFLSQSYTKENPSPSDVSSLGEQKTGTVAAWDITVTDATSGKQNGRVFADTLFLNMGSNGLNMNSVVYVLTNDSFLYKVDFNGADPYGFVFFANNRGLLQKTVVDGDTSYSSLYHSVADFEKTMDTKNVLLNLIPTEPVDKTYYVFFNQPTDSDLLSLLTGQDHLTVSSDIQYGGISDISFTGGSGQNGITGIGQGGVFSFTCDTAKTTATSFEIRLDLRDNAALNEMYYKGMEQPDNIVVLSNVLQDGDNEIAWNGKDVNGNNVPVTTLATGKLTFKAKQGEVHFPLADVEKNPNGIKITLLNSAGSTDPTKVYYDNETESVGDNVNHRLDGTSSSTGAMKFTGSAAGAGNDAELDIWTYYELTATTPVTMPAVSIKNPTYYVDSDPDNLHSGVTPKTNINAGTADVTVTPIIDAGYHLSGTVTAKTTTGAEVTLKPTGSGSYTYTQPDGNVLIRIPVASDNYTITYNNNGATAEVTTPPTYTVETPDITFGTPTKTGYSFSGWFTDSGCTAGNEITGITTGSTGNKEIWAKWTPESSEGVQYTLAYESNGGTAIAAEMHTAGAQVTISAAPMRAGYSFGGWYLDAALSNPVSSVRMSGNITVYAKWIATERPSTLTGDHMAYIIGRTDGLVHPTASITRGEVATILFRLLDADVRSEKLTKVNSFSDMGTGVWCNTAVSTLSSMGIISGRNDGTFDYQAAITRAEMAAMLARFSDAAYTGADKFLDISGHWAASYINAAANYGWILGSTDGKFRPNDDITRAETVTMVNRVLNRQPESTADLLSTMEIWPDNLDTGAWYYLAFQEATNSHDYEMKSDNVLESWTALTATPDWKIYEIN